MQDDMIEGEMFKQLGVKEEDKESDEEVGHLGVCWTSICFFSSSELDN